MESNMTPEQLRKPSKRLVRILSDNIRRLRRERAFSQEQLSELCGLHRTYVGSVERGERNVTLSTLEAFSHALGVSVPELLTQKGNNDP
jgi:transcriptional regulator with XRE-family HTH domain